MKTVQGQMVAIALILATTLALAAPDGAIGAVNITNQHVHTVILERRHKKGMPK